MAYIDKIKVGDITYTLGQGAGTAVGTGTVLWENPDPTAEFPEQNITLSSSDYDYLKFYCKNGSSCVCTEALKGYGVVAFSIIGESANTYLGIRRRHLSYVNDTTYSVKEGQMKQTHVNTAAIVYNTILVPLLVVGYKNESSTNGQGETYSTEEQAIGTWIDGKTLYRKVITADIPSATTSGTYVRNSFSIGSDIDKLFIKSAYRVYNDIIYPLPYIADSGNVIKVYEDSSNPKNIVIASNWINTDNTALLIVEYTKNS